MREEPPMPNDSEGLFKAIRREFTDRYVEWLIYHQLFGTQERVALLNETASSVFSIVQRLFLDNFVLAFSRLTDGASTGGNKNLSIRRFINAVQAEDPELADLLDEKYEELKNQVSRFRTHRNKRLAHLDLATAIQPAKLEPYLFGEIPKSFELLKDLLNTYEYKCFGGRKTAYELTILPLGTDGDALIQALKKSNLQSKH